MKLPRANRAKIKIAAHMCAMRFVAIQAMSKKNAGGWNAEEF